jgi:hypothetical protein
MYICFESILFDRSTFAATWVSILSQILQKWSVILLFMWAVIRALFEYVR